MFSSVASFVVLSLSLLGQASADSHLNRHREVAHRARADVTLHKRYDNARWTYYDVGLGACGKNNVASDFIVALNSGQFGGGYPGPNCFKTITMTYKGKSTQATIMDECPGCPIGGLDLSRGLFDFFASESEGVIYGSWSFSGGSGSGGGGGGDKPKPTTKKPDPPPPTTHHTTTTHTTPTSTWVPPTTSTTHTTSSTEKKTSSSSSVAPSSSSVATSSSVAPSAAIAVPTLAGIQNLNQAALGIAGLVVAGASSS